jgi:hypothetical protein
MDLGDHQEMERGLGADIPNCYHYLILVENLSGHLACYNITKDAHYRFASLFPGKTWFLAFKKP